MTTGISRLYREIREPLPLVDPRSRSSSADRRFHVESADRADSAGARALTRLGADRTRTVRTAVFLGLLSGYMQTCGMAVAY